MRQKPTYFSATAHKVSAVLKVCVSCGVVAVVYDAESG
jgi:hypothetical protein